MDRHPFNGEKVTILGSSMCGVLLIWQQRIHFWLFLQDLVICFVIYIFFCIILEKENAHRNQNTGIVCVLWSISYLRWRCISFWNKKGTDIDIVLYCFGKRCMRNLLPFLRTQNRRMMYFLRRCESIAFFLVTTR